LMTVLNSLRLKILFHITIIAVVLISVIALHGTATAPTAIAETEAAALTFPSCGNPEIDKMIVEAGSKYGVDPKLVYAVIRQESNFKVGARSHKNAQGLMQMIPATAERFKVEDPYDPEQNIQGGVRYLRWLLKEFKGDVKLALAGYNAGEGAVKKAGNQVPEYKETQNYVKKIVSTYGKTHHPVLSPEQARERFAAAETQAE
jgi:soluble lytic murein transglycosylase-like protein